MLKANNKDENIGKPTGKCYLITVKQGLCPI